MDFEVPHGTTVRFTASWSKDFTVALPDGFPDHAHRGFVTLTYLLPSSPGGLSHEDFLGAATASGEDWKSRKTRLTYMQKKWIKIVELVVCRDLDRNIQEPDYSELQERILQRRPFDCCVISTTTCRQCWHSGPRRRAVDDMRPWHCAF